MATITDEQLMRVASILENNSDFKFLMTHKFKQLRPIFAGVKVDNGVIANNTFDYIRKIYEFVPELTTVISFDKSDDILKAQANYILASMFVAVCIDLFMDDSITNDKNILGYRCTKFNHRNYFTVGFSTFEMKYNNIDEIGISCKLPSFTDINAYNVPNIIKNLVGDIQLFVYSGHLGSKAASVDFPFKEMTTFKKQLTKAIDIYKQKNNLF